jgi:hypothetical protein
MTNKHSAARLAAAMIGAALLLGGIMPGLAQTATKPTKPAVKRAAPASPTAAQGDYWKIEYALPEYEGGGRRSAEPVTVRERTPLDRKRLDNGPGSVGFSSGSGASAGQLSDGRAVPGMERYNQQPNSGYAGMSLSVPTLNNTLVPANTPWGPPQ